MATVREIAALAGVSVATVSRVLNAPEKVAEAKRHAVQAVITSLHYQIPAPKKPKPTGLFGVILPDITNPFFSQFLDVLEKEAYLHGRNILLLISRHDRHLERVYLEECIKHKVDGVFLFPLNLTTDYVMHLKQLPYPVVMLTRTSPLISSFGVDHFLGGELAARYLTKQGHTNVGYIGSLHNHSAKWQGFSQYMRHIKFPVLPLYCFDVKKDHCLEAFLTHLWLQPLAPTAFFCMNDVTAQNVLNILERQNKKTVELVGFDNSLTAKLLGFSSIAQPIKQMAHRGFETMLILVKANDKSEVITQYFAPKLVARHAHLI